jgi:catechol 2,3-dioxygenase-like lactoylglutathione lyase family enzyme
MENIIAKLLQDFEEGKLNRRQLIRNLAISAGAASVAATAPPAIAEGRALSVVGIHHISYRVADYRKTRDLYADLFGLQVSGDNGKQCNLALGTTQIIARNGSGTTPQVDHISYAIDNWNTVAVEGELKRRGLNPQPEGENSLRFSDPDGYHVQLNAKR